VTTELQQNRYDQILRRVGGLIGPGSKVSEVISELFPMIDVERVPGELLLLGGTALAWGNAAVNPVAVMNGRVQLFNPVDSGTIITLTQLMVRRPTAGGVVFGVTNIALSALQATRGFRDARQGFTAVPIGEVRQDTNATATPNHYLQQLEAGVSREITDENSLAVLTPGFGVNISNSSQNDALNVGLMWRERAAEPSELNF